MFRYRLLLVLIAMPVVLSGCSTAAKEAYYTVRGPQANVLVIRPVADHARVAGCPARALP